MKDLLPHWLQEGFSVILPGAQILLILAAALLLRGVLRRLVRRAGTRYQWADEAVLGLRRLVSIVVLTAAAIGVMQALGVSGTVLWTAFTGFAAVAAVAFFAAWSVLSNLFCTVLILTTRPFRLHDHVELLESGDKPGLRGEVIDINFVYTTLREDPGEGEAPASVLQVPNNLFFQRTLRRWKERPPPRPVPTPATAHTAHEATGPTAAPPGRA